MAFTLTITGTTAGKDTEEAIRRDMERFSVELARRYPTVITDADFVGDLTEDNLNLNTKGTPT